MKIICQQIDKEYVKSWCCCCCCWSTSH